MDIKRTIKANGLTVKEVAEKWELRPSDLASILMGIQV